MNKGMDKRVTGPDKSELRCAMKARRKELAAEEKAAEDAVICEKLKARSDIGEMVDPFDGGAPLAVYLASPDEIDIDPYIEHMLHAGVELVAPRWNGEIYELAKVKGVDEKNLRRGPMGIREPVDADIVDPKKVSAWIVPGLAFTRDGKRLGYGGGWYDRFLASAPKGAVKIGVAYSFQIVDDLPAEPHDIPLTDIVDDSLDDEALEFKETQDGFSAKVIVKDKPRRVKVAVWGLLCMAGAPVIGFGGLLALAGSAFVLPDAWLFVLTLCFLLAFVVAAGVVSKMMEVSVESEICFVHGEGICRRRLFGRIPLPARRFALSPWSRATGGTCDSRLSDSDFDTVKIWTDGEYVQPCRPLVKTYARTALMLAIQINRANKWDDAAYNAARRTRLANLPRGMKICPTDDGQGMSAVIRPFSPNMSFGGIGVTLCVLMLAAFLLYIPYVGWALGGVIASATLIRCLFGMLRGLFGCVRCEIRNGRMNCASGLWPFVRKCEMPLAGKVVASSGGYAQWRCDVFERCSLFWWLPVKFILPLRLFAEEAIALNPADERLAQSRREPSDTRKITRNTSGFTD